MKRPNLREQLARALADYDNLRKRVEREKEKLGFRANLRLILKLLPVLDSLRQAQVYLKDQGLAITLGEIEDIFKDEGIEEIKIARGDKFNPELEEVTEVVETDGEVNKIVEVVLSGWRFTKGPVIRHAKVKVNKRKEITK